ncbi:MAG: hypothetical protein NTX56_18760, partial [Proteobacteria bacterium]|nr:hypothetical protein [Pseudomonadota bacterium]
MANYVLLEKITVGAAGAASVTFSSIPQTGYTDLIVKTSVRELSTNSGISLCKINSATTGYSGRQVYGNGGGTTAGTDSNYAGSSGFGMEGTNAIGAATNVFCNAEWTFTNYASSNYKSIIIDGVNERDASVQYMAFGSYLWSSTASISSLTFTGYSGSYAQYSTFYLYGVAKTGTTPIIAPKATGGQVIETDGTYWYHAFLASGTFTPSRALTCEVLTIGGGGSSGQNRGGGGGAGGLIYTASQSFVSGTPYYALVGAGGPANSYSQTPGVKGSNTTLTGGSLSLTTSYGGGGGGSYNPPTITTNGSGGGGGGSNNTTAGLGTSGQGNNGGVGFNTVTGYAGGGGGG